MSTKKSAITKSLRLALVGIASLTAASASAQYYQIANQLPSLISPALSGSFRYKGYVDLTGTAGLGDNRANFVGISTSQGFQYSSWFFMGVGIGVDVAMANQDANNMTTPAPDFWGHPSSKNRVMIPVFSDFRFIFGGQSVGGFLDLKLGSTWIMGDRYLRMSSASLSNQAQFLLRPTLGIRIPISSTDPRQAVNIGITYQLITSSNNYTWYDRDVTLNSLGFNIGFEW